MTTVLVTGMSGYIGSALCRLMDVSPDVERFVGMDVKKPLEKYDKGRFRLMDVNDPSLFDWVAETRPQAMVHLAFVLNPTHDEKRMAEINLSGTQKALDAAAEAGVRRILVTSSATAYGAWPDNPVPLRETDPIRPHPGFAYARHKGELEHWMDAWEKENSGVELIRVRPCIVFGPRVGNFLSRMLTMPFGVILREHRASLQFVHEDDVARALLHLLLHAPAGPYNLAPPDAVELSEIYKMCGKRTFAVSDKTLIRAAALTWRLRLPPPASPPGFVDFVRYPWLVDPAKLLSTGYAFRYSSKETVEIMLRAKGRL
ncbi:MAG: NAD-dependent epimerase/dehydratase family protein [Deltaproteobacteria bacterium]|nr:NAD-dependent epimerase/dehydratase family protein [Deltaproteobacteria bacterium]